VLRLTEHLEAATPLAVEVRRAPELERPLDAAVVQGAPGRLHEATGWRPEIPLERSLTDILEWWRSRL
jgi:GDP-4-dehydro-6-deoxy-D-mannose reductase